MGRTFLTGAAIVRPDRVERDRTLVIDGSRIAEVVAGDAAGGPGDRVLTRPGCTIVPGFIDAHVHGVAGTDVMDGDGAVRRVAAMLPQWGVTAFCPTSIACPVAALSNFLDDVARAMARPEAGGARVLPAHIESAFINPEFRGAQPLEYLCDAAGGSSGAVRGDEILAAIDGAGTAVGIVTLAPETPGGLDLVRRLVAVGIRVSLGHSGATFDEARAAIHAGASRATHLYNAMAPLTPRAPGLVGAVLTHDEVTVELIADGVHVHPAAMRVAIGTKAADRVAVITDGTAASGLPRGSRTRLGSLAITAADTARLDDGRPAGSVLTMDRAFANLVTICQYDLVEAARMCATTPARDLGLAGIGAIETGRNADLVVLRDDLTVEETWIRGRRVWSTAPD